MLEGALDNGITEQEFWDMTFAEIDRAIESKKRMDKLQAQEKAYYDYTLADLIGRSISRLYTASAKMPSIEEAYPTLFNAVEIANRQQAKKDELSAIRFKQFATSYNKRWAKK